MKLHFTKMHALGNDYIYINNLDDSYHLNFAKLSQNLSRRSFSIGADGIIVIQSAAVADARMEMYNADGSRGAMCGNGLRSIAHYLFLHHLQGQDTLKIETDAGIKYVSKTPDGLYKINMGLPIFAGKSIPTIFDTPEVMNKTIVIDDKDYIYSALSMGNPHAILFVDDIKQEDICAIGKAIQQSDCFPEGVNVNVAEVGSFCQNDSTNTYKNSTIILRTYERGSGLTLACGSGACATAVIARKLGHTDEHVHIHMAGGTLQISYNLSGDVFMIGDAVEVCQGSVEI